MAMAPLTEDNFTRHFHDFLERNPDSYVMIRPDRPMDEQRHRYATDEERRRGNAAMLAWFEYLAAKRWQRRFNAWRSMLRAGHSLMLPCERPEIFDLSYIPASPTVLRPDFWNIWEVERAYTRERLTEQELARRRRICENTIGEVASGARMKEKSRARIGDSRTPSEAVPWEERARDYRENASRLSEDALKTHTGRPWSQKSEAEVVR